MRFAISLPQGCPDGTFDPARFAAYVLRAEELGFDSAWAMDLQFGRVPRLNAMETMTFAAAYTALPSASGSGRLRLGCSVWISPLQQPVQLAKSLSTLDQLSRGRLEVGLGSGGQYRMFSAFGMTGDHLITRFTEGIEIMKALWTEPEVTFDGRFYQLRAASMEPKPMQKPRPPLWLGGGAPPAVRRAARLGDGFFGAGSSTTAAFAEQVQVLREALAEQGRDPVSFPVAKRIYIAVDDDADRARTRMADALIGVYGQTFGSSLMPVTVTGSPADCVRGVQEVADAGAELILLTALFDEAEQLERFAAEVIPHVH
jgi:alkanesulfonate monooxygenase SsuD/methylene tetrahydromethanopterin reductase-like flavin-dependent oxidoreductase (luciferase family)